MISQVENIEHTQENGVNIFSADFECDKGKFNLWFKTKAKINPVADVFLACTLVPAMRIGSYFKFEHAISPLFHFALDKLQSTLHLAHSELEPVYLAPSMRPENQDKHEKHIGCFFTAGADSFYTALTHPEITKLVYVHGFDLWLHETEYRKTVSEQINRIA